MADHILYACREFDVEPETGAIINERRVVHTQGNNYFEAGGRISLPDNMPLDFPAFEKAFQASLRPILCEECGGHIEATAKMKAFEMAAWSKSRFGKQLCARCAKKAHEKAAEA